VLPGRVFALPLSIYSLVHKSTRRTWELPPEPVPALMLRNPSKSPALLFLPVAAIAGCRPAGGAAGGSNHKGWNSSQPSIRGSSTQPRPPLSLGAAAGGSTPDNPASLSRLSICCCQGLSPAVCGYKPPGGPLLPPVRPGENLAVSAVDWIDTNRTCSSQERR